VEVGQHFFDPHEWLMSFNNAEIGPIQFIALKEEDGEKPSKENTDRIFFPCAP